MRRSLQASLQTFPFFNRFDGRTRIGAVTGQDQTMHHSGTLATALLLASIVLPCVAQQRYDNPVDQQSYVTAGQWKTHLPATPRETRGQRVTTAGVLLLTGEPDVAARVTVADLGAYIKSVEALAYAELGQNKSAMKALVQLNCHPGKCAVAISTQGTADDARLQALHAALARTPPLKTTGEVVFQVAFNVAANAPGTQRGQ
jgi:hypothetical protein